VLKVPKSRVVTIIAKLKKIWNYPVSAQSWSFDQTEKLGKKDIGQGEVTKNPMPRLEHNKMWNKSRGKNTF
jgi:hypothetical protein